MKKIISCCGVVCSDCEYYPGECKGCPELKGKVFWLQYTGQSVCDIYDCCVNNKRYPHCGNCKELPCKRYEQKDPTRTAEENEAEFKKQLKQLKEMDTE